MIRLSRRSHAPLVAALLAAAPAPASGVSQANPGDLQHRNDCRLAEQILIMGEPARKRAWALEIIGTCPGAVQLLPSLWASPPADEGELEALYHLSLHAEAPEGFQEGLSAAQDPSAPSLVRLAGLGTAVSYVHPDIVLYLADRRRLEGVPPLEWNNVWGRLDHPFHPVGAVALPPGAAEDVADLVAGLRADPDADPLLRDAAFWLAELIGL